jgi:hypothetical protein
MRAALEARLGDEIRRFTPSLDPAAAARANELGRVEARVQERAPAPRRALDHDANLGADLRELVAEHMKKARASWETRKAWSITVPLPVWDEYAHEARLTGRSITECLVAAIGRDYHRRRGTVEPLETLDQEVRAFHAAAVQLLQEARQVIDRVGPLNEIGMRLARIEGALGSRTAR